MTETLLRLPAVTSAVGYCRSSIYNLVKEGKFPAPVKLAGGGAVAWRSGEIEAWIAERAWSAPSPTRGRSASLLKARETKATLVRTSECVDAARALADRLGFATESDVIALTESSPATVETWRKRRQGPPVVRAGNAYLYPLDGLSQWLQARIRKPLGTPTS